MIRWECDYAEGGHPALLDALTRTNMEQTPGYGVDAHCDRARGLIRDLSPSSPPLCGPTRGCCAPTPATSTATRPEPLSPPATRCSPSPRRTEKSPPSRCGQRWRPTGRMPPTSMWCSRGWCTSSTPPSRARCIPPQNSPPSPRCAGSLVSPSLWTGPGWPTAWPPRRASPSPCSMSCATC